MEPRKRAPVLLFVEPSLARHRRLRVELRRRGAQVLMGTSVGEALELGELFPPTLIVVAEGMRDFDGDDLAGVFRASFPHARVVLSRPGAPEPLMAAILEHAPGLRPPPPAGEEGRVLCVDDDPQFLRSVTRFLTRYGYHVYPFENGEQALKALEGIDPDLAILDVRMPGTDGIDLARRIRDSSHGRVPVVLLTAVPLDEARSAGRGAGVRCTLSKEGLPDRVVDVVDALIGDVDEFERALLKITP